MALFQDIPLQIGKRVEHADNWHHIDILDTSHGLLTPLADHSEKMHVYSYHHQAIDFKLKKDDPLQLAAVTKDGVTEALEFKNGRGLLLQFHPELMGNKLGSEILRRVVEQKNLLIPPRCSQIF